MSDLRDEKGDAAGFQPTLQSKTGRFGIQSYRARGFGKALIFQSNTTFTASDRESSNLNDGQRYEGRGLGISPWIHTQIHEVGNALSN